MSTEANAARVPITQIVARGSCPICLAMREFQNKLLKNLQPSHYKHLCNAHAWVAAHTTPAESVTEIFLRALTDPEWRAGAPVAQECDLCKSMHAEREARLNEFAKRLQNSELLRSWLQDYGMLCLRHSRGLVDRLPDELQKSLEALMARNISELVEGLTAFREQVRGGSHSGGGILGHVAEFLVAQRGIEI